MTDVLGVVQWTTGKSASAAVRAVVDHPGLDLVGCHAWSPDKRGRDVGELCGIDPIGVAATDDGDALLALEPDCVGYTTCRPDIDHFVRILEARINVGRDSASRSAPATAMTRTNASSRRRRPGTPAHNAEHLVGAGIMRHNTSRPITAFHKISLPRCGAESGSVEHGDGSLREYSGSVCGSECLFDAT